ncbi:hypothetical protein RO3G_12424 [Rhizopus delemar RA 99-880]|uniref:Peptidase C14 caspase domain-containing protein n=1 Tax=Rhizopus delemar (strain RA 99-880 / ATCC MYA-4621 / FGSC 9543 / NRRL 43880) TaxID=246409 RepID=I1CGY3_RHIO9|nr:hypothetical protein RO3G_12424 [Rhizopus delemar RA 99-880]|eukprot:EIE87713.1 hypothetical protein RO3G_12424 [Rhizopus delemar RA 99-880]
MSFPGQGYTAGGYAPGPYPPYQQPPHTPYQQQYPPPPQQYPPSPMGYPPPPQGYPPPQTLGYPPPQPQGYPAPAGYSPQQHPYGAPPPPPMPPRPNPHSPQGYSPYDLAPNSPPPPPPPYTPQDPAFSPHDPTVGQANYPQPPQSAHNPSVPYGQPQPNVNPNDFIMHVHPSLRNAPPPNFQLSNYFLITMYNFRVDDMVILTDDQQNPQSIPTKQNMIRAMQWLVHDARPNDSFFFHFSGHGGRMKDYDGDEDDGYDETIYPVDHSVYGQIVDDVCFEVYCHSGTALDLPYVYSTQGALKESNIFKDAGSSLKGAGLAYLSGDPSRAISSVMSLGSRIMSGGIGNGKSAKVKQQKSSPADVIMFSGCKDAQTSADAFENGRSTGAMSYAFTTALRSNRNQSYLQLLNSIRVILKQKYDQRPQLSSSHPMDINLLFMI